MPIHLGATDLPKVLGAYISAKLGIVPANQRHVAGAVRRAGRQATLRKVYTSALNIRRRSRVKKIAYAHELPVYPHYPGSDVIDYGEWWNYFAPDKHLDRFMNVAVAQGHFVELIFHNSDTTRLKRVELNANEEVHVIWTDQ